MSGDTSVPEDPRKQILEEMGLDNLTSEELDTLLYRFEHMSLLASIYDALLVLIKTIDPEGGAKRIKALQEMHEAGKHYYKPPGGEAQ